MKAVRPLLSKAKFFLNRNPIIEKREDWRRFVPDPFRSVCTITADFELAWAWRYMKASKDPHRTALEKAKLERRNIPRILELCDRFTIPITWATVGHLFLESCDSAGFPHRGLKRLPHFENEYWTYKGNDWFENDPCSNYLEAPEWYAPDLVEQIVNSKVEHEIGCHTFSHIDCRDEICPPEIFEAEINECKKAGTRYGVELKSFVHPGFTIGNLDSLAELGFTSFQSDPGNVLGYPVKKKNGLWEIKRTFEFTYREGWSINYHIYRYEKIIERAIKNNCVCNFWFHPSLREEFVAHVMPHLFHYIDSMNQFVYLSPVGRYVDWLRKHDASSRIN